MENNNTGANNPNAYENLNNDQQIILQDWIFKSFERVDRFHLSKTSYGLKALFENSPEGFYISNGQFKGAMLAAGYKVKDKKALNWQFNISTRSVDRTWKKVYKIQ